MICEFCGREIPDDAKYCLGCGERVVDAVEDEELFPMKAEHSDPLAEETDILDSIDDLQTNVLDTDTSLTAASESTNKTKYLLIAAATVGAICVGGYLGFKTSGASDPQVIQSQGPVIVYDKKILSAKGNKIQEVKEDGSEAEVFYEGKDQIDNLVSDNNNVYFTEGKDIVKLEPKQDKTEVIHDGSDDNNTPSDINVIDDKVYFNDDETIKEVDKDGKNEKDVLEGKDDIKDQLNLDGMIVLDNKAYFTGQGNNKNTGAIYELDLVSGEEHFLYSPEHCSDLNGLTVLPENVYFIQEDTYEGPYHIYEMARKEGSKVNELAVTANSDESYNNLVILDGKAYFTKTTGEGVSICSISIADKKIVELSKISDSSDFVVDELGIANGKLYYSRAGKLFYVNADGVDQKPGNVKEESTLYSKIANETVGDVFVADNGDTYYVAHNYIDDNEENSIVCNDEIYKASAGKLSDAKKLATYNDCYVYGSGNLQMLNGRLTYLWHESDTDFTGIYFVDDNTTDKSKAILSGTFIGDNAKALDEIVDYTVVGDDIYYLTRELHSSFASDVLYKFNTTTKQSVAIETLAMVDTIINVDGCVYVLGSKQGNNQPAVFKLVEDQLESMYTNNTEYLSTVMFNESMIYSYQYDRDQFSVKRCNLEGGDLEDLYASEGFVWSMNVYNDRLYIMGANCDEQSFDLVKYLISCDLNGDNQKKLLEGKLEGIKGISGAIDGGLLLDGKSSELYFYNVENETLELVPSANNEN